jgi:hypothetical protein
MSPEARSAARMLSGGKPAKVPKGFSKEASDIWRGIVNGKRLTGSIRAAWSYWDYIVGNMFAPII